VLRITQGVKAGDEEAFREFYCAYCDRLFRYLLVLTNGEEQLARDSLQIVMTKAARSMKPFAEERLLWNWLAAIARHTLVDAWRRSRTSPQFAALGNADPPAPDGSAATEADSRLMEALEACLDELEPEARDLVEAYYFRAESQQAIAEQHGATSKAVESKLARIRLKLRQSILQRLRHDDR
jgi:RNA polymerase sigma-70 factor (ECF subfamily)